jgi:hypothetical protein
MHWSLRLSFLERDASFETLTSGGPGSSGFHTIEFGEAAWHLG